MKRSSAQGIQDVRWAFEHTEALGGIIAVYGAFKDG
jgi:hypothetical protein